MNSLKQLTNALNIIKTKIINTPNKSDLVKFLNNYKQEKELLEIEKILINDINPKEIKSRF
jgi:hypothetical protein